MKLIRSIRYILVIVSAILGLLGLSSTFGYEIVENCYSNNWYSNNQCWDITNDFFQFNNGYNKVDSNFNLTFQGIEDYNAFVLNDNQIFLYWGDDQQLHFKRNVYSGVVGNVCTIGSNDINDIGSRCGYAVGWSSTYGCWANYTEDNSYFYNTNGDFDKIYWLPGYIDGLYNNGNGGVLCGVKGNGAVCMAIVGTYSVNSNNVCKFFSGYVQDDSIQSYGLTELSPYFYSSPFSSSGGGSSDTPSTPSYQDPVVVNSKIYDIFVQQGYSDNLCYGGYSLDNILSTSTGFDLSDIILGSGANIFELYDVYSGGNSFVNWYDTYYQYFNYARFSDNYGTFNGKSKGLLGLMATKQAVNSSFESTSIQNFCRLVIDGFYDTPVQTPIGIINDSVADWQLSEVIGSVSYTPPSSGSNIDTIVQTLIDQGVIDGYTGVDDLSDFYTRYQDKLNQLTVKAGENGILPGYIALGFFAILMIYIFKK